MGTWDTKINANDTFLDIYQSFFDRYNEGQDPAVVSVAIQNEFAEIFNDHEDRNNSLFGLALAQWETKILDPSIFQQVKEIIESGNDIELWKALGADDKTLGKRKIVLEKFLTQLSTVREKPKRRARPKHEFTYHELINITAPGGKKTFTVTECMTNGVYQQTASMLSWGGGGGSILYFTDQGKFISAKWLDSQTLEVTHDKDILFTKKHEKFGFCGDEVRVIYVEKWLTAC